MAFKLITLLAIVAMAHAGVLPAQQVYHSAQPAHISYAVQPSTVVKTVPTSSYAHAPSSQHQVLAKHNDEYDPHPQYKYSYDVQDALTGDNKSQMEERDGDVVHGEYSLNDADGFRRTVQYTVDPVNGFNAVVNRVPLEHVKTVVKTVAAPIAPATIVKPVSVPVAYHQHH